MNSTKILTLNLFNWCASDYRWLSAFEIFTLSHSQAPSVGSLRVQPDTKSLFKRFRAVFFILCITNQ